MFHLPLAELDRQWAVPRIKFSAFQASRSASLTAAHMIIRLFPAKPRHVSR